MVEAMAEKADLRMLARKVSHDQFETACDDLAKGIELAIGKLNMQVSNATMYEIPAHNFMNRREINFTFPLYDTLRRRPYNSHKI